MKDIVIKVYFADVSNPQSPSHVTTLRCPRTVKVMLGTDEDEVEILVKDNGRLTTTL